MNGQERGHKHNHQVPLWNQGKRVIKIPFSSLPFKFELHFEQCDFFLTLVLKSDFCWDAPCSSSRLKKEGTLKMKY